MSDLDRELADAVSDLAAARRRSRRSEVEIDQAELTLRSVLVSHIERGTRCSIHLAGGTVRHGVPSRVGADFVLLTDDERLRLIALVAVEVILDDGTPHPARTEGRIDSRVHLADVLAEWSAERRDATLITRHATHRGRLMSCGIDLVRLQTDEGNASYVLLDSLIEASSST